MRPREEGFGPNLVIGLQLFLIVTRDLILLGLFISLNCILYLSWSSLHFLTLVGYQLLNTSRVLMRGVPVSIPVIRSRFEVSLMGVKSVESSVVHAPEDVDVLIEKFH